MKKTTLFAIPLLAALFLSSCKDDRMGDEVKSIDPVKIDSVNIPKDSMAVTSTMKIWTYSNLQSKCEGFYGYDYIHVDEFTRNVTSYKFKTDAQCGDQVTRYQEIRFQPQKVGNYTFKFWNGKDSGGQNVWIQKNIKVY
ncbi:hypothetical protein [Chryseobacterium koreense]|uniref:Lipoprotein n=1 Tax=Chryseobacterium koreense CCUG 49689 TaxID=1304281 RepID=A0A0J7J2Y5_9FLAO|nr:hypothetical protein [Chryseobacterium koreense]KMQ72577.1 hypothetical protein ACM44_00300 [Chryseobacterium koreense CCUG 49689]MBB5332963.1 hypothetical protein [Chryseobacterium koreense]